MEGFIIVLASIGATTVLVVLLLSAGLLIPNLLIKLLVYKETKRLVQQISETEFKAEVDKVLKEQATKKPTTKKTTATRKTATKKANAKKATK